MRTLVALLLLLVLAPLSIAQSYRAKAGETVLRVEVEGRGAVYIRLFADKAPRTVEHIVKLARSGFYNNQRFHRVELSPKPYLVQVGDPNSRKLAVDDSRVGNGGSGSPVPFEDTGLANVEGAVGLARTIEDKNSGDSQFYIVLGPARFLDGRFTVFGQVAAGMDVVKRIELGDRISSATIING